MPDKNNNSTTSEAVDSVEKPTTPRTLENIRELLEKNLKLSEETLERTKYIKRFVIFSQIFGALKILLIVVPLVLGILYLPPLFRQAMPLLNETLGTYQELLGTKKKLDSGIKLLIKLDSLIKTDIKLFLLYIVMPYRFEIRWL